MKRITISLCTALLCCFLLVSLVHASLLESCIVSSYGEWGTDNVQLNAVGGGTYQVFKVYWSDHAQVTKVSFPLKKSGTVAGNLTSQIYLTSGTYGTNAKPNGTVLAESDKVAISTIGDSYAWINFTFSGTQQINITRNIAYAITFYWKEGSGTGYIGTPLSENASDGNYGVAMYYGGAWSWYPQTNNFDLNFRLYGYEWHQVENWWGLVAPVGGWHTVEGWWGGLLVTIGLAFHVNVLRWGLFLGGLTMFISPLMYIAHEKTSIGAEHAVDCLLVLFIGVGLLIGFSFT